jgi:hypothetical protein
MGTILAVPSLEVIMEGQGKDLGTYYVRASFTNGAIAVIEWTTDRRLWDSEEDVFDTMRFIWTDGNYSCDCNRGTFIARTAGLPDPDLKCGYTLALITLTAIRPNGAEVDLACSEI